MALQYKALYPWLGGLNTSQDPIILDPQNLVQADNLQFTLSGSRKVRGGQARYNTAAFSTANLTYMTPYWATVSSVKKEWFVATTDDGKIWRNKPASNTTFASFCTITISISKGGVSSAVMDNDLVIGVKGNTLPLVWSGQNTSSNAVLMTKSVSSASLPFSKAWIVQQFIERGFFAGDPGNPDTLYVSEPGDYRAWRTTLGSGSATTLNVGLGDGDPEGITAIFPGTSGARYLYIAKRNRLYQLNCTDLNQANWAVTLISDKIGCLNQNAWVTIDDKDVIFASDRGVHSLNQVMFTTAVLEGQHVSAPVQNDYYNVMTTAQRGSFSMAYVPQLNSVLLATEVTGQTQFNTVYGYNLELKQWFRWTNYPCNFIRRRLNTTTGNDEIYLCDNSGFLNKGNQSSLNDFGNPIVTVIKSSIIYPGEIPFLEYAFTRLGLVYRSYNSATTFSVTYYIDGLNAGTFTMDEKLGGGNLLGTTKLGPLPSPGFLLGLIQGIKPNFAHLGGVGSSIQIQITNNTLNSNFELFGMLLEFEAAGDRQYAFNNPIFK